jgi:hypothetical protein
MNVTVDRVCYGAYYQKRLKDRLADCDPSPVLS